MRTGVPDPRRHPGVVAGRGNRRTHGRSSAVTSPQVVDLHDGGTLVAADLSGLLPAAALAGAQVRSAAEQLAGWSAFDRPPAPVVAASTLPGWVGPLDIVVVLAGAVDDMVAAEAAAQANRRGARLVVRASGDGP